MQPITSRLFPTLRAASSRAHLLACVLAACSVGGCKRSSAPQGGPVSSEPAAASVTASAAPIAARPEPTTNFEVFSRMGYSPQWVGYPVLPRGRAIRTVDPMGDLVVVQEAGNTITAMDASTGANRWTLDTGNRLARFVGNVRRDNGDVIVCSESEVFVVDSGSGVVKERQRLDIIVNTKPVLTDNILVFGGPGGDVLGHSVAIGYKAWAYRLEGTISAPAVRVGPSVAMVSQGGEMVILNAREGTADGRGKIFAGLVNAPVASDETVFIASLDQSLYAFDRTARQPKWRVRFETQLRAQPAYHGGAVYLAVPGEGLVSFSAADGSRRWAAKDLKGEIVGERGGSLIHWEAPTISTLDPATGDVVASYRLASVDRLITDAFADGNVYAVNNKGEISKFTPRK